MSLMALWGSVWAQPSVSGQRRTLLAFARWANKAAVIPPLPDVEIQQMVASIVENADANPREQHRLFIQRQRIRGAVSAMQRRMRAFSKARRPRLVFIERGRVSPASSRRAIQENFAISRATTYRCTAGNGAAPLTEMKHADRETARQLHQMGLSPEKIASIRGKKVRALRAEGFDVDGLAWTIGGVWRLLEIWPESGVRQVTGYT